MPNNVQNTTCISRATSGRLPSNDEDTPWCKHLGIYTFLWQFSAILFTGFIRVLSFAGNALERYSSPHYILPHPFPLFSRRIVSKSFGGSTTNVSSVFFFILGRTVVYNGALFALLSLLKTRY